MAAGNPSDRITCPHCQGSLKAPPLPPGSLCTCPKCGQSFPVGVVSPQPAATKPAPSRPAPATNPPAAPAPRVQERTQPKPPVIDAPVRAELATPRPAAAASSIAPQPVVTVAPDDVIGQMLLGSPPATSPSAPQPPAAAAPSQPARRASPPVPPADDPDQDRRLKALLSAPIATSNAPHGDAHLATATTQPAHQQTPPPPKPAAPPRPKPPEIPVVCKLCGTRMYAKPEQVGTRIRCPDCHSDNEVFALPVKAVKAAAPVSLDHGADFTLAEPSERPAYRPLVEPRGEAAAPHHVHAATTPARPTSSPQPRAVSTEMTMTLPATRADEEDDDEEIVISPPVERIDVKQVVKLPPPDDPNEDNQYRGRFRDDEWGFVADPKEKEAWKKSPFYFGILGFLFYPQTLYRWIFYSVVMTVDLMLLLAAAYYAQQGETATLIAAVFLTVSGAALSTFMVGGAFPCLKAIAQDTANGYDQVESWPDWNIAEWLISAMTVPAAAFLASLPGAVVAMGFISIGREALLLVPFAVLGSELLFFPIIFGSMLAEGSFMPVSGTIFQSMQKRGDGWLLFYMGSILLGMLLTAAVSLVELGIQSGTVLVAPFAAVLWVGGIILYFRLLGRLLWYVQNYRRQRDLPE